MHRNIRQKLNELKCGILIPTFNNEKTITTVAAQALEVCEHVWVVNDGSTDSTLQLLQNMAQNHRENLHIISYSKNAGKGVALKTGFRHMLEHGMENAITMDADGQHLIEDIPTLAGLAEKNPQAIIAGTRNVKTQEGMPGKNSFANQFSNFWFKVETGMDFPDTQCGLRLYPIKRLSSFHFFSTKYEFELEVLVRAAWAGIPLVPASVHVYYPPAEERVTHFRPFQDFSRISVLNTILVVIAFLYIKPRDFFRKLTWKNIKNFFNENLLNTGETAVKIGLSVGVGVMFGILPIWGYQIIAVLAVAHLLGLNKCIAFIFSNISLPPFIPFILLGSYAMGAKVLNSGTYIPTIDEISLDTVGQNLFQYVVGAILLAILAGAVAGLVAYLAVKASRHFRKKEQQVE